MAEPLWLDDDEQRAWRAFVSARQLLEDALDRELQRDAGMSHAYYMILTMLVEADDHTMRMSDLARLLHFSPSRLTHAVASLERSGWVTRRPCPDDGRGQLATLTPAGLRAQHDAAPGHVAEVRTRIFDRLTPAEVAAFEAICTAIVDAFAPEAESSPPGSRSTRSSQSTRSAQSAQSPTSGHA